MTPGALFVVLFVGLAVGSPVRRQTDGGKFGYEYDVQHPSGSSSVHVRTGGDRQGSSYRANNLPHADYASEASYVDPHYVDPYHQPNRYGHYPSSYNRVPLHGHIGGEVPVYEEHLGYPKSATYQYPSARNVYPQIQDINSGYSNPKFVQQADVHVSSLNYPQNKIEQTPFDLGLAQQVYEPQLSVGEDVPIISNYPVDQQVLVDEPVISQKTLVDEPVFSQITEDISPPKIFLSGPETPIVQQASVDISPHFNDDVVVQVPLDNNPGVLHRVGHPVVQTAIDEYPSQTTYDSPIEPTFSDIDYKPSKLFAGDSKYQFVPVGPPYQKISHSTEIIHGPPRNPYSSSVKLPPQLPVVLPQQQEYIDEPLNVPISVKLPPPPVTKSLVPIVLPQQQEYIDEPLIAPVSVKLPPPPVTKSVVPVVLPQQQEYIDEPLTPLVSVKVPPPPVTKSVVPVVLAQQQEHVDVPLIPLSPVTKSVIPVALSQQQEHIDEPFISPVSVKLPPPPVTKSVVPIVLPQQQEYIDEPLISPVSVKLPPPPVTKSIVPVILPQQQEYIDEPLLSPVSVKLPPPPVTKSITPVIVPVTQEHINQPIYPSVKLPLSPPVTKSFIPAVLPPVYPSVKHPPRPIPIYKSPPLSKPFGSIKTPPYAKIPVARYPPVSYSVKQPYARSYHVKTPYVSTPPLAYVPFAKSPIPYSVKRPYAPNPNYHYENPYTKYRTPVTKTLPISHSVKYPVVSNLHSVKHPASVKGYPYNKAPPAPTHFSQSPYVQEPLPIIPHSVKSPHKTVPVTSPQKYLPVGHSVAALPPPVIETGLHVDAYPEIPFPSEEKIILPPSHAFQITPVITPSEIKPDLSTSIVNEEVSSFDIVESFPLDKSPPVSHSIRLPLLPLPPTTQVPNLFAAVPAKDGLPSIESPLQEKKLDVSPLLISEPKVSALRSDILSNPVSHSVRLGAPRSRGSFDEPRQDFPAFPVASAYGYPDPVSDKVNMEIGANFGDRIASGPRFS